MARRHLRPAGSDDLGLRRALSDRLLPLLVGAMAFLAALALSGAVAASALARHWREGAAATVTVQVPGPDAAALSGGAPGAPNSPGPGAAAAARAAEATRLGRVLALLRDTPGIASARALDEAELADLLRPWLGAGARALSLPLPAVIEVRLDEPAPDLDALAARLTAAAPGTLLESQGAWMGRLTALARSLQACGLAALGLVGLVAAAVVMVSVRAGLAARRDAIEIVHGLGATDGYIAGRFAGRATALALGGALGGTALAVPVLAGLAGLAAPFAAGPESGTLAGPFGALPAGVLLGLAALPAAAAAIGWLTAQGTVRRWLRRLP